jgi:aspartate-semialdehyde dehydrogenase
MSFRVAVVGATGMVGREMLKVLEQRKFPVKELVPLASARSAGKKLPFAGGEVTVQEVSAEAFEGIDVALFSAGSGPSKEWSPIAAEKGAIVIDNSSAFRKDPECPLVVPEVNLEAAKTRPKGIIANPNCSTIQMVVAIAPIHRVNPIERIIVATYQAISGAGAPAVAALEEQQKGGKGEALGGQLAGNVLMHWKVQEDGYYQEEELKMLHETRKILGDDSIRVSPTAVRVPVVTGHAEAITLELSEPMDVATARELLSNAPGVEVMDDFKNGVYPTPLQAAGTDPVYVGRIREDVGNPGGLQLWVVADNLRKGAALNAVQIAEGLLL